jgi:hypothetical protein
MTMKFVLHATRDCGRHSHPEIVVPLDEASSLVPDWLVQYFETAVRSGQVFKVGQTVQIGGGLVKLQDAQPGTLELWEPDFKSMPIQWVRGVNGTLRQLLLQKAVAELVGAEPDFAFLLHAGQVQEHWPELRVFEMHRDIPEGNHTGWSIEAFNEPPPSQLVSIYDLGRQLPISRPFLALPPGVQVEISPDRIEIEFGGRSVSSVESRLLSALLGGARS